MFIAIAGDGRAVDQLHDEKGPPDVRDASVEHARDVRVLHQGEGLPFRFEARDKFAGFHPEPQDFQRHPSLHGGGLVGQEDHAETAFADALDQFIFANLVAGPRIRGHAGGKLAGDADVLLRRFFQEVAVVLVALHQSEHALGGGGVAIAALQDELRALGRRDRQGGIEDLLLDLGGTFHPIGCCSKYGIR